MEKLQKLIESNAKSIQSLSADLANMKRDRDVMYNLMSDLTSKMAILTAAEAKSYETMKNLDNRQQQLTDQQQQLNNMQQQLIEIVKSLTKKS